MHNTPQTRNRQQEVADRKRWRKIRNMLRVGDSQDLKTVCTPVPFDEMITLHDLLADAIHAFDSGVGLAAPQLGITKRALVLWPGRFTKYDCGLPTHERQKAITVMLNPVILARSGHTTEAEEMCLSYPGLVAVVARANWVDIEFTTIDTGTCQWHLTDYAARVFQHEAEHLEGICQVGLYGKPPEPDYSSNSSGKSNAGKSVLFKAVRDAIR